MFESNFKRRKSVKSFHFQVFAILVPMYFQLSSTVLDPIYCVADVLLICDSHATCQDDMCVCRPGYQGDGVSCTEDTCADCHSLATCTTSYPTQGEQILTSSGCQCSSGLVGDGSSCSALSQSSTIYLQVTSAKLISSAVTSPMASLSLPSLPLPMVSTATQESLMSLLPLSTSNLQMTSSAAMMNSSLNSSTVKISHSKSQSLTALQTAPSPSVIGPTTSIFRTDLQTNSCSSQAHCIIMKNSSCVCYCMYVARDYPGFRECLNSDFLALPEVTILNVHKQPFMDRPEIVSRGEESMFQASVDITSVNSTEQLSFAWFIRNVSTTPLVFSNERTLVQRDALTWNPPLGSLTTGLKIIEFEVRVPNVAAVRRDFGFIKVQEPSLVALINGGSDTLLSSKNEIIFNASDSFDPGIGNNQHSELSLSWSCFRGGQLVPLIYSGHTKVVVLSEPAKKKEPTCGNDIMDTQSGFTVTIRPNDNQIYYIKLVVKKDHRQSEFLKTLYAANQNILRVAIRCITNCHRMVISSHRFSLNVSCSVCSSKDITFRWRLYSKGLESNKSVTVWYLNETLKNLVSTKPNSKHLAFKKDQLQDDSFYWLTVDVELPDGMRGWAAYRFKTVATPSGGECNGSQMQKGAFGITLYINCTGWYDENKPLEYEFFQQVDDGSLHMLRYGVIPFGEVHIPKFDNGEIKIKVVIINSLGARTETHTTVQVVQPLWLSGAGDGLWVFEHTKDMFDKYLIQRNLYDAWQIGLVLAEAMNMESFYWITPPRAKELKYHIIQEMSRFNAGNVQSILLLSSVLKVTTSIPEHLFLSSMEIALDVLHKWVPVIKNRLHSGGGKDRSLETHAWNELLHNSGNILHAITQRVSSSEYERIKIKELQLNALKLNDVISDAALSLKLTGEEYSSVKTEHHSLLLGKQESREMSNLQIKDGDSQFIFPELSEDMTKTVFGEATNVHVQMISYNINPHILGDQLLEEITSKVLSVTLKDEYGNAINISNLHSPISLTLPLKATGNRTTPVEEYSVPDVMLHRVFTESRGNSLVKLSFKLKRPAPFEVYVKYGARPTNQDYDYFATIDEETCQNGEEKCNVSTQIWFDAERKGKYFIGMIQKSKSRERRSASKRDSFNVLALNPSQKWRSRSLFQLNNQDENLCVKFKDPPTPQPVVNVTVKNAPYDPETSVNFTLELDSTGCLFWSETEERWMSEGCKPGPNSTSSSLQCLCNHLTSFGGYFLVTPNTIDFDQVQLGFKSINDPGDVPVIVAVLLVFLLYLIAVVFARRADKRDLEEVSVITPLPSSKESGYQYKASVSTGAWRNSGTSARVCMILYGTDSSSDVIEFSGTQYENRKLFSRGNTDTFLFTVDQPIGSLVKIQVGHDNSGDDPSWFLNEIFIIDIQANSRWRFPCYRWLGLELEDGSTTLELHSSSSVKRSSDFKTEFSNARTYGLANDHLWFSIATKERRDLFTRVQRLTCCCFFLLWIMIVSAMFYFENRDETRAIRVGPLKVTANELAVSVTTALVAFPPTFFVVFLFRNSQRLRINTDGDTWYDDDGKKRFQLPHFCIHVAWFVCIVGSLLASVFTILYSLQWGREKSERWLSSIFLTTTEDIFVSQPLKIVLLAVILALRYKCIGNRVSDLAKNGKSFQSDHPETMFDIAKEDIETQRKYRVLERKTNLFVRDMLFACFFLLLLMFVCYGDKSKQRHHIAETTRNSFTKFDKVKNVSHLWTWLEDVFIPVVYAGKWYNGQRETTTEYTGNKRSILVGMPRLRQLRVMKDSCDVPDVFKNTISSCYDFYCQDKEDKLGSWSALANKTSITGIECPENWRYSTEDETDIHKSRGIHSLYSGGGYVANLGYDDSTARRILKDLVHNGWIDRQTRAILVEFSKFNVATKLLVDATLYFEMIPSGFLETSMRIPVIPMAKSDSVFAEVYMVNILLFAFVLGYYLVTECVRVYRLKCAYFNSIWNGLEMLQIVSAVLVLATSVERERQTVQVLQKLEANPFAPVSFHDALLWFEIENYLICITVTTVTLRFLKLLKFNSHIIVLFQVVRKSFKPILSYAVVFCVIFTAYGHAGFLLFGKDAYMFSTIHRTIASQFLMCLGDSVSRSKLENTHIILTRLYVESLIFITMAILINMFVAILNDAYSDSTSLDEHREDIEVADLLLSRFLKFVGIQRKEKQGDSSSTNEENKKSKENIRQEALDSVTELSDELELPMEVDMGVKTSETNWLIETSEQFPSSLSPCETLSAGTYEMVSASRYSFDERGESSRLIESSFLTDREAKPTVSRNSLDSSSFDPQHTPIVIRDEMPSLLGSGDVRMVHYGSGAHARHLSITSSNLSTSSFWSSRLSDLPSKATANSVGTTDNTRKWPFAGESVEVAPVGHACHTTREECDKWNERIISFDEVSEWLKRINLSGNKDRQTSDRSEKTGTISVSNGLQVGKRAGIDFDAVSKMIKTIRKVKEGKENAKESNPTQLINRAKRIDRLLYVLD